MAYSTPRPEPTHRRGRHAAASVWNQPTHLLWQLHQRSLRVVFAVIVLLVISFIMIVALLA